MKKFLSFILVLGVFVSAQVFAQEEAQVQKNIYLYLHSFGATFDYIFVHFWS